MERRNNFQQSRSYDPADITFRIHLSGQLFWLQVLQLVQQDSLSVGTDLAVSLIGVAIIVSSTYGWVYEEE